MPPIPGIHHMGIAVIDLGNGSGNDRGQYSLADGHFHGFRRSVLIIGVGAHIHLIPHGIGSHSVSGGDACGIGTAFIGAVNRTIFSAAGTADRPADAVCVLAKALSAHFAAKTAVTAMVFFIIQSSPFL